VATIKGKIKAISISAKKGTKKTNVPEAELKIDFGIVGDAHGGNWHRQISLLAIESIDKMVRIFYKNPDIDYINNIYKNGVVHGAGCELVTREALEKSLKMTEKYDNKKRLNYCEHVTVFIRKHPTIFNIIKYKAPIELSRNDLFFTVDYPEDLKVVNLIFKYLYKKDEYIHPIEIIVFLDEHPEIAKLNSHLHNSLPEW